MHNNYLKLLLKIFIDNKIPICISNGNHDLDREAIIKNRQFEAYTKFVKKNKKKFQIQLSKKFKVNQACYYYLKEYNSLFISTNSCKNIEKKLIDDELPRIIDFFNSDKICKYCESCDHIKKLFNVKLKPKKKKSKRGGILDWL